jgi:hypothetical protein
MLIGFGLCIEKLLRFIGRVSLFCLRVFERLWGLRRVLF